MDGRQDAQRVGPTKDRERRIFLQDPVQFVAHTVTGEQRDPPSRQRRSQAVQGVIVQTEPEPLLVPNRAEDSRGVIVEAVRMQGADDAGSQVVPTVVGVYNNVDSIGDAD